MTERLILFLLLIFPALLQAQAKDGESKPMARAVMLGMGRANQLDTYLSPIEYQGMQWSFLSQRQRMTRMADGKISFQSQMHGTFSITENPAVTANEWGGRLAYDAGWHYHWALAPRLQLKAGGLVGADVGFLYNNRNSNNPAQGRAAADISASVGGAYSFNIARLPFTMTYQADLPLMGCMFSPHYGQSYYEISQGNRDQNVRFTYPGNALSLRQLLTLDFIFKRTTLRLGYLSDIRQSHVNGIKIHDISRSFMLGYVRYFQILKNRP